jgi:hypothetical protein
LCKGVAGLAILGASRFLRRLVVREAFFADAVTLGLLSLGFLLLDIGASVLTLSQSQQPLAR